MDKPLMMFAIRTFDIFTNYVVIGCGILQKIPILHFSVEPSNYIVDADILLNI